MYDIFDAKLVGTKAAVGRVLVPARFIDKPAHTGEFTVARSTDQSFFKSGVSMLADLELLDTRRDNLHHRNSGLDSTSAKLCAKHSVMVGINLANLRKLDPVIMGRVKQNIELCRKYGVDMCVFTSATRGEDLPNPSDIESLLRVLGMSTAQTKATMNNLEHAYLRILAKQPAARKS